MTVIRRQDWRTRFAELVVARRDLPTVWGERDCCLFAADAVKAMTDVDFAESLRGYRTAKGAARALRRAGFASVIDYVDARLPRATRARDGDLLGLPCQRASGLDMLFIADGGSVWGQDEPGLIRVAPPPGAVVWRV